MSMTPKEKLEQLAEEYDDLNAGVDLKKAFLAGAKAGMEEAARMAEANDKNGYLHGCQCAKDIRQAAKEE